MLTQRRGDAEALNAQARQLLRDAGQLGQDQVWRGKGFAVGDLVVTRRNERARLEVSNGTRGRITAIDQASGTIELSTDRGANRRLPAWYLAKDGAGGSSLNHAYATTGHKSQGVTVDRALAKTGAGLAGVVLRGHDPRADRRPHLRARPARGPSGAGPGPRPAARPASRPWPRGCGPRGRRSRRSTRSSARACTH